jgi:hypothetical protein
MQVTTAATSYHDIPIYYGIRVLSNRVFPRCQMLILSLAEFFSMVHVRCDVIVNAFVSLFVHDVPVHLICFFLELLHSSVSIVMLKFLAQYIPVS